MITNFYHHLQWQVSKSKHVTKYVTILSVENILNCRCLYYYFLLHLLLSMAYYCACLVCFFFNIRVSFREFVLLLFDSNSARQRELV